MDLDDLHDFNTVTHGLQKGLSIIINDMHNTIDNGKELPQYTLANVGDALEAIGVLSYVIQDRLIKAGNVMDNMATGNNKGVQHE